MNVARKELITAGMTACRERLVAMGFTAHANDTFTLPLAPQLRGWITLARAIHRGDGSMAVTPIVGLLHQGVNRLVSRLARLPYYRYAMATVQTHLRTVMPPDVWTHDWVEMYPGQSLDMPADEIAQALQEYGQPWIREHASLEAIFDLIITFKGAAGAYGFKRPIIAQMLGRHDLAREYIREGFAQLSKRTGPGSQELFDAWERFAQAFNAWTASPTGEPGPHDGRT